MRTKKKKSKHSIPSTKDSLGVISYQLREIREDLAKNNKDIEVPQNPMIKLQRSFQN